MSADRPFRVLVVPAVQADPAGRLIQDFVEVLNYHLSSDEVRVYGEVPLLPGSSRSAARRTMLLWPDLLIPLSTSAAERNFSKIGRDISLAHVLATGTPFVPPSIPVVIGEAESSVFLETEFADLAVADLRAEKDWPRLLEAIRRAKKARELTSRAHNTDLLEASAQPVEPALEISGVQLRDIGCFRDLVLKDLGSWVTVLGDNAAGKSTLLRAIALGLCAESDATVLLKSLPGPLLRDGAKKGSIRIQLRDSTEGSGQLRIETVIESGPAGEFIRKTSTPDPFPWERVFACGYGTGRSRQASSPSRDAYSALDALRALFEDRELQNPEVILQRQENGRRRQLEERLMSILMLDEENASGLTYGSAGVTVRGPWGDRPFRVLSDGYRSTSQWVLDFCAWAIYAGRLDDRSEIGGILLIDEIEQHLHPRWQREFVQRLRKQFPKTQIFTTTHTPLVASGVADLEDAQLIRLKLEEDGSVGALLIEPKSLDGMRADQVLTSEAFGLVTSRNLGSDRKIDQYTALLGQDSRTAAEEAKMAELAAELEDELRGGETEAEREVEKVVGEALKSLVTPVKPEVLEVEAKRQLRQLFSGDKSEAD